MLTSKPSDLLVWRTLRGATQDVEFNFRRQIPIRKFFSSVDTGLQVGRLN